MEVIIKGKKLNIRRIVFTVIFILAIGSAVCYFYNNNFKPKNNSQKETNEIVSLVGKLMVLPEEQPTIATVTDIEQLKDQPFFVNAKKGDIVLIYTKAKKAILYDPVSNKIVEVSFLNTNNNP